MGSDVMSSAVSNIQPQTGCWTLIFQHIQSPKLLLETHTSKSHISLSLLAVITTILSSAYDLLITISTYGIFFSESLKKCSALNHFEAGDILVCTRILKHHNYYVYIIEKACLREFLVYSISSS